MSVEYFIMPILSLIAVIIALFTDTKDEKKKWLVIVLIFSLMITSALDIYFKSLNERKAEAELSWSKDRIKELIGIVSSFRSETNEKFADLINLLKSFGWVNEKLAQTKVTDAEQSLQAEEERILLASVGSISRRELTTIEYLPKDVDGEIVVGALQELGFRLTTGIAQITDVPTNAIWFGSSVPLENIKLVAYTLIRAGVKIKVIRPFRNPRGVRASLIQVGADELYVDAPALTVEEIRSATQFIRKE